MQPASLARLRLCDYMVSSVNPPGHWDVPYFSLFSLKSFFLKSEKKMVTFEIKSFKSHMNSQVGYHL